VKKHLLGIAVAASLALTATPSTAAPHAHNAAECSIAQSMAIVAQALSRAEIDADKSTEVMAQLFIASRFERGFALMRAIIAAAQQRKGNAVLFGREVGEACRKNDGNMDSVLGGDS
jgi:hypothetical protein